jgi:ribosome maturation factor RimP
MTLTYIETGKPVRVGDKVPGKRLEKFYAHIEAINPDNVVLCYNGEVRSIRVGFDVIDAELR